MMLNKRIEAFYDQSTPLWLDVWGEHMHHGYYENGKVDKSHAQAQLDLVDKLLEWGKVTSAKTILDAGCGVGGSARILAKRFDAEVLGLTLSPVQVQRGNQFTEQQGLASQVTLEVKDMMEMKGANMKFDLIWSMESAEHIKDKAALLKMFYGLLNPGGRIVMATWCHRDLPPQLKDSEQSLLEKIYKLYHLPPMVSIGELVENVKSAGFEDVSSAEWSDAVAPFWKAVIKSVFQWKSLLGLGKAGWSTIKGAWAMRYMTKGYNEGIIKFGVIQGQKL